jgi:hypothetical protein
MPGRPCGSRAAGGVAPRECRQVIERKEQTGEREERADR